MVSSPKKTPRSAPKRKAAERRILIEKITPEKPNAPREHAVYVAGAGPSPESPITVDFALSTR